MPPPEPPRTFQSLEDVFATFISAAIFIAGIVCFIMLLVGGFKWLTSGGDPGKLASAKNTLTYAIGGLVLLALAYLILRFIAIFTGVQTILNFRIFLPQV